ncbi:DUF637 domain-containing protein [Aeromonas rivuli]|uniref:DUF637 domain-containing protein n=1 Tax=Aeromonas rivuli TaxID=648794 RepID=UPI0012EDE4A2|nr:DUF637 domain-containing protein [Aeromonas rivuli]
MLANIQGEVGQSTANVIGDNSEVLGQAGKMVAHGVTSGAIAEITGGKFAAVAAGGAISEWSSGWVSQTFTNPEAQIGLSQILGGLAAVAVTGDQHEFNTGAGRAETVHRYNYLSHQQKDIREQDFASCQGELLCVAQHGAKWDAISALQETSYGAGLLVGVPAGMVDSVQGLVQLGLNPAQTLDAIKSLITSGDLLGNVTDAVKQNYLARVEAAEAQYQKAGASGSFNASVEYGKLLAEGASLVAGGVGAIKGAALLTEKITAKLVREGVGQTVTAGSKGVGQIVAQYGPINQGSLPKGIADTFRSGTYSEIVTQQPTTLYRVYGGTAQELGGYWTTTPPSGPVQSIIDSALNPKWGNTATNVVKIEVPKGIKYFEGIAAPQGGLVGGGNQVLFPKDFKIDPSWIKE